MKSGIFILGIFFVTVFFLFFHMSSVKNEIKPIETRSVSIDDRTVVKKVATNIENFINLPLNLFEK